MSLRIKVFFAFMVLSLSFAISSVAQSDDSDVAWYESFFLDKGQKPIEETLRQITAQQLDAKEKNDKPAEARALIALGLFNLAEVHDYEQSMEWLVRSLAIEDSLDLKKELFFTYLAIAHVYEEVGNYSKSKNFLEEAKKLNDANDQPHLKALLFNEFGRVNASSGNIAIALENYGLLLDYAEQVGDKRREADALFHIGKLLTRDHKYKDALDDHKKALALRRELKDRSGEAVSLNEIGELYKAMNNEERALANHVAALEIRQNLKEGKGLAESYNNIGVLYFQQKNYQRAVANFQQSLEAGRDAQPLDQIKKSHEYLSLCYKELKDYKQALEAKEQFLAMHELIQGEKDAQKLLETQNKYSIEKKEGEISKLEAVRTQREKQIEEQKKFRNFLFLLIGLAIIIVVLILYLYIAKQRSNKELKSVNEKVSSQNEQLQELNATKDKFFSIIGHDLKGPLNSLTSFSGLLINHTDSLSKDEIKMLAKDLDKSLKNLFALLENLLEWSRSQTGNIEFKAESFDLATVLKESEELLSTQAQNKKIKLVNEGKTTIPVKLHKHSINTVVRNLLSNAIKFTPEGGTVIINAQQNQKEVMISISDTGVGMGPEVIKKLFKVGTKHSTKGTAEEKGTGLGLILCKEFIEKNGGQIGVNSEEGKGSVFYFTLPNQ